MPQTVTLYRLLVASPSDCGRERQLVQRSVNAWNVAHAEALQTMIEPVLWETHAQPSTGQRVQEALNRQLVDRCDFLVAIFATRLGSDTGRALSGTVEEITRFRSAKKPIMVYFSAAKAAIGSIDVQQLQALREYRANLRRDTLAFDFRGPYEFVSLFGGHLARLMADTTGLPVSPPGDLEPSGDTESVDAEQLAEPGVVALASLRLHTRFLWAELYALPPSADALVCEIKRSTLNTVRKALEALVTEGLLSYRIRPAYRLKSENAEVLTIRIHVKSERLRLLVAGLEQGTSLA